MADSSDKPRKAATPASRCGNGAGWGGPAKGAAMERGERNTFEPGNQAAKGYHDMSRSERLAALDERKWNIGMGLVKAEQVAMKAIDSYEDRHMGKAVQAVQHSGPDGGPLQIQTVTQYQLPSNGRDPG